MEHQPECPRSQAGCTCRCEPANITDARAQLGGLARAHGYEVDYAAWGAIVDTYTRGDRKVQVKFSGTDHVLKVYVNGQPQVNAGRSAAMSVITQGGALHMDDAKPGANSWDELPESMQERYIQGWRLSDLQLEAIRGVLEEVLTTSGSTDPRVWGMPLLGDLSRILDMTSGAEVMKLLAEQKESRATED